MYIQLYLFVEKKVFLKCLDFHLWFHHTDVGKITEEP